MGHDTSDKHNDKQTAFLKPDEIAREGFYWVHAPTMIAPDWRVVKVEFSSLNGGLCVYDTADGCDRAPLINEFPDTARFVGPLPPPPRVPHT